MKRNDNRTGMAEVKLIPLEVLLGHPEREGALISPDGKRLSYLAPLDGVLNVFVGEAGSGSARPVTHDTGRGIQGYMWAHDNRHLLYARDEDGSENVRLYDVDLETGVERDLTPMADVQCRVIAHYKQFPNEVLIGLNKDNPQLHDVYHLDLTTGELEKIVENPGFVEWVVDNDLKVRGGLAKAPNGSATILVRDDEASEWRPLLEASPEDAESTVPLWFTNDGQGMYVKTSVDSNTERLVEIDIATGTVAVIAEDPTYDIAEVIIHPDTWAIQSVTVYRERLEYIVLDDTIRGDVEALERLNAGELIIIERTHDDTTWLVAFDGDCEPVKFYLWDREAKSATFLFDNRPQVNDYPLVPMEPFAFAARDGLTVHGYLSFPADAEGTSLPAVLVVHGGPWGRDVWGLNPEAQWLANRGYLCVQVNFRGSTGYGKDFLNAGDREWGGKMHDDLLDAINHLVTQGIVDRDRVAIYGGGVFPLTESSQF
jgi:dipeptidyl aminopeptidase/acylaminoacyl peptidase